MRPQYTVSSCQCGCGKSPKAGRRFILGHWARTQPKGLRKGPPMIERILAKLDRTATCWLFLGGQDGNGYGVVGDGSGSGRNVRVHRAIYEWVYGPIPAGLWVLHKCDVRNCARPDHLFLGTIADNTRDMVEKGRNRWDPARGEGHKNAKLTDAIVKEMRQRYAAGGITGFELARTFGMSYSATMAAISRTSWRHVS